MFQMLLGEKNNSTYVTWRWSLLAGDVESLNAGTILAVIFAVHSSFCIVSVSTHQVKL
jgi:hypothetical protein